MQSSPPSSLLTLHISRRTFYPVFLEVLICLFLMATWILIAWIRNARRNRRYKRYFFFCIGQISGPLADCAVLVLIIQTPHFSLFDPQCLTQFYKSTTYSFFFSSNAIPIYPTYCFGEGQQCQDCLRCSKQLNSNMCLHFFLDRQSPAEWCITIIRNHWISAFLQHPLPQLQLHHLYNMGMYPKLYLRSHQNWDLQR